jgi:predicted DNA-binding transcriptional regulator YafY
MRRADRLYLIVEILRREGRPVTAEAVATELEVSKRTVYRDVADLIASRVPISGEAGIGYVLESGYYLPPLMLTEDEIDALVLGVEYVKSRGEHEIGVAARSLLAKVQACLPERLVPLVDLPTTSVAPVASSIESIRAADIRASIRARRKLELKYSDAQGSVSTRKVWPVLLGYRDHGRILAAWCELREDFRYFRTERIAATTLLDELVPERASVLRKRWKVAMDNERERFVALSTFPGTAV